MKSSNKFIVTASVISAGMLAAVASATPASSFGQLTFGGTPITMSAGSIGNDGYRMNTSNGPGGKQLLIGIKAHAYASQSGAAPNMPASSSTVSAFTGSVGTNGYGGSWLNTDNATGAYMGIAGEAASRAPWWSGFPPNSATSWGFAWSITLDGQRPVVGELSMSMLITRPDGVATTTLFTTSNLPTWDVGTNFYTKNTTTPSAGDRPDQQSWNVGYLTGGGGQASQVGDWKIKISTFVGATAYGEQEITVTAVPAPGAIAVLGLAGFASRRRRA